MSRPNEYRQIAERAAEVAVGVIAARSSSSRTIRGKGDRDFATDVDLAVEDEVRRFLAEATPDVPLVGEERGRSGGAHSPYEWVIDPVDGTVNFLHGSPLYSVSLALMHEGVPTVGVVSVPQLGETYSAATGHGATLNQHPMSASNVDNLADALVSLGDFAVGDSADERNAERFALLQDLVPQVQRIRMLGSAAIDLCWVALGRLDATIILSTHLWDIGAGAVIAQEAGAVVVDRVGGTIDASSQSVIASSEGISRSLLETVSPQGN